jgi:hypothetical protein
MRSLYSFTTVLSLSCTLRVLASLNMTKSNTNAKTSKVEVLEALLTIKLPLISLPFNASMTEGLFVVGGRA